MKKLVYQRKPYRKTRHQYKLKYLREKIAKKKEEEERLKKKGRGV